MGFVQCDCGSNLNRLKRAVVEVRLQFHQCLHDLGVADEKCASPAGHRIALCHRIQLNGTFQCAFCLQN